MGPEADLLAWRGHQYDARTLRAAYGHRAPAGGRRGANNADARSNPTSVKVRAHLSDVHEVASTSPAGTVCTCGLVVPAGLSPTRATGHLDQRRWERAASLVWTGGERGDREEPATGRAYCQPCGWVSDVAELDDARALAEKHLCLD